MAQNTSPPSAIASSCVFWLSFGSLTFVTVLTAFAVRDNPWSVAFVLFFCFDAFALLACLRAYEKPQAVYETREGLKIAIWVLANALHVALAYHFAEMMPLVLYAFVWAMSGFTALASFYGMFVHRGPEDVAVCRHNLKNNDAKGSLEAFP